MEKGLQGFILGSAVLENSVSTPFSGPSCDTAANTTVT